MRLHCAEVLSDAPTGPGVDGPTRHLGVDPSPSRGAAVKALFIDARLEGFFLERFGDDGELIGTTQHETMDEAMWQAYSEFVIADWSTCPEDVNPAQYIRARRDR